MKIHNNQYNQTFKSLILTDRAKDLISCQSKEDQEEIERMSERLENSKYWDLEVDGLGSCNERLCCRFVNKQNPDNVHQYGLFPYKRIGKTVMVSSIIDDKTERLELLTFPNEASARAMINMNLNEVEQRRAKKYEDNPLSNLKRWEQRVNFLDEAYECMDKKWLICDEIETDKIRPHIDFVIDDLKEKMGE